jgi:hypothetical protein
MKLEDDVDEPNMPPVKPGHISDDKEGSEHGTIKGGFSKVSKTIELSTKDLKVVGPKRFIPGMKPRKGSKDFIS